MLQRMTAEIALSYPVMKIVCIMIIINSWYHGGELIHIPTLKNQIGDIEIIISEYG